MTGPWVLAFTVVCAAQVICIILVLGLLRRTNGVLERVEARLSTAPLGDLEGFSPGQSVPNTRLQMTDGVTTSSSQLFAQQITVVVFLSSSCEACDTLRQEMRASGWNATGAQLLVAQSDTAIRIGGASTLVEESSENLAGMLGVMIYPLAYLIDQRGIILGRDIPSSMESLESLITSVDSGETVMSNNLERA